MEMRPFQEPAYQPGISCDDREKLLKALEVASASKKMVKLPVYFERNASSIRSFERAYIGTEETPDGPHRINLRPNDSALGVSLADRIAQYCPEAGGCCLWLVGMWHEKSLLDAQSATSGDLHAFGIRSVFGSYKAGEAALAYIAE